MKLKCHKEITVPEFQKPNVHIEMDDWISKIPRNTSRRFLRDFGSTTADLMTENYDVHFDDLCRKKNLVPKDLSLGFGHADKHGSTTKNQTSIAVVLLAMLSYG